ncbi:MAG: hypothetical protein PVH00_13255 [Gemmatimonadota bacterium]|jgi:hypothetical protein
MADRVRKISYVHLSMPNRAGRGARTLEALKEAGVNLIALHAFPGKPRMTQVDLVPENMTALRRAARQNDWKLSKVKRGFLVQGDDRVGAAHRHLDRLAEAGINIIADTALAAGKGRYAMILWVNPKDYARAARVLKAR